MLIFLPSWQTSNSVVQILLRMCPNLDDARDALLAYIEAVHSGIKGFVTDAETGRGISGASVSTLHT